MREYCSLWSFNYVKVFNVQIANRFLLNFLHVLLRCELVLYCYLYINF